jgi:hypothetical protein
MKDQPETTLLLPSATEKFLEVLDGRISVSMMLDVEMDQVPFHVFAEGDSAVISFDSLSDAMALLKRYKAIASKNNKQVILFKRVLSKIGITVCYQNHHFGFIGPKANLILSKFFTFATSSKKKGKASLL